MISLEIGKGGGEVLIYLCVRGYIHWVQCIKTIERACMHTWGKYWTWRDTRSWASRVFSALRFSTSLAWDKGRNSKGKKRERNLLTDQKQRKERKNQGRVWVSERQREKKREKKRKKGAHLYRIKFTTYSILQILFQLLHFACFGALWFLCHKLRKKKSIT